MGARGHADQLRAVLLVHLGGAGRNALAVLVELQGRRASVDALLGLAYENVEERALLYTHFLAVLVNE